MEQDLNQIIEILQSSGDSPDKKKDHLISILCDEEFEIPLLTQSQSLLFKKWLFKRLRNKKLNFSVSERRKIADIKRKLLNFIQKKEEIIKKSEKAEILIEIMSFARSLNRLQTQDEKTCSDS